MPLGLCVKHKWCWLTGPARVARLVVCDGRRYDMVVGEAEERCWAADRVAGATTNVLLRQDWDGFCWRQGIWGGRVAERRLQLSQDEGVARICGARVVNGDMGAECWAPGVVGSCWHERGGRIR